MFYTKIKNNNNNKIKEKEKLNTFLSTLIFSPLKLTYLSILCSLKQYIYSSDIFLDLYGLLDINVR